MRGAFKGHIAAVAPLLARIWRSTPSWLRGTVTWAINGKVMVGVSGLLLDDSNQILLLRHRFHDAGIWGMPGGWLSPGETICDCWRREVKEELDLDTAVEGMICHRATRRTLEFFLLGRISGGQVKIDPVEILEARFFSVEQLPPMERFHLRLIGETFLDLKEAERAGAVESARLARVGGDNSKAGETLHAPNREEQENAGRAKGDRPRA